jgi:hypothetical protein
MRGVSIVPFLSERQATSFIPVPRYSAMSHAPRTAAIPYPLLGASRATRKTVVCLAPRQDTICLVCPTSSCKWPICQTPPALSTKPARQAVDTQPTHMHPSTQCHTAAPIRFVASVLRPLVATRQNQRRTVLSSGGGDGEEGPGVFSERDGRLGCRRLPPTPMCDKPASSATLRHGPPVGHLASLRGS